ncbi:Ger(x)C family spore germination protein [Bacillus sp. FJAT-45350]|uniref:Ger(x)C family spore germination protein n=1 Tax=Bacillus sp. FJAT-45350 TaxID=2011014 RepID=UPI000BB815BA|nr:Ger(x)C family spore germination protein [Bacillus sp. FJAT-45350]
MKHKGVLLFLSILVVFLSSCVPDSRELDQRSMILGMAIDIGEENLYKVTIQLPVLGHGRDGGTGVGPSGRDFETFSSEADSLWEAITELESRTPTVLFFGHLKAIAVSEAIANNHLKEVLDLLDRNSAMANQLYVVIIEGVESGEFIKTESPLVRLPALYLDRFFRAGQRIGRADEIMLLEFLRNSNMISGAASLPLARLESETVTIEGAAIFKDYDLVAKLKKDKASINVLLREDEIIGKNHSIVIEEQGDKVTVSVGRIDLISKVSYEKTKPIKYKIEISGSGAIEEITNIEQRDSTNFIKKVERELNEKIERDLQDTIEEMKEINVEPWLLGHRVWAMTPEFFDTLNWNEEGWRESIIDIDVDVEIQSTGQRGYHHKKKIGR